MHPAAFLHDLAPADLPEPVRARARLLLLDLLGVAAAGSATALSRIVRAHAAAQFGAGARAAGMLMDGRRVSPAGAALAGGMTIDALDAHDGHRAAKGHAGCGALPAALAMAEATGRADGAELLAALVLGYEIGTRAGIALHRRAVDYHTAGAWVAIAAAGIGARALGLGTEATRHALGIAEYHGPRSQMMRCIDHPTMLKDGSGWGAMAGVSAAYLAAEGFTGTPAVTLEGADVAGLWCDLGRRWRILGQYWKPWPVCRWAQPAVQAALDLRAAHGVRAEEVGRIEVETFHEALRLATRRPRTTEEAQYSTAFPVAATVARGRVGAEEVSEGAFEDPEILRLADGMAIAEDADCNAAFPGRRIARVALVMRDGRRLASPPTEARGEPGTPPTPDEVRAEFASLAVPVLGAARAAALERTALGLGETATAADLVAAALPAPALTPAPGAGAAPPPPPRPSARPPA